MYLHIEPKWQAVFKERGLDSYRALLNFRNDACASSHGRGATWRLELTAQQVVFIKQDYYTKFLVNLRNLVRGRRPLCNTAKERRALALAARHGFRVPEVIAWGEEPRYGLPNTGVMVMLPLPGMPVDQFVADPKNQARAEEVISKAEDTLAALQSCRLDWKTDCKPEHFFILDDGTIGVIDLERLRLRDKPLAEKHCQMQRQRFRSLLPEPYRTRGR
ncbi:MAG: phosphotransferase [Lentisphaeria bacterium]|jgi:hypothetical protein|nr:phosphotransferase [Lentisphaeria bacterium]